MIQASQIAAGRPTAVGANGRQAASGEGAALSAAIQRLISERDRHKGLATVQEEELIRLRAINEELRRQNEELALVRDRYLGLAAELLAQLQQVDSAIHEALRKSRDVSESGDAAISAFARRFRRSETRTSQ
jgi:predicted RNase H-like nuclease (RuvC/YqgF family)